VHSRIEKDEAFYSYLFLKFLNFFTVLDLVCEFPEPIFDISNFRHQRHSPEDDSDGDADPGEVEVAQRQLLLAVCRSVSLVVALGLLLEKQLKARPR
jgi:hypothetical protein